MGNEQQAHAVFSLDIFDQFEYLSLDRHIERRGRFIGYQQCRSAGKGHGDHHPLALSAGKLMRIRAQPSGRVVDAGPVKEPDCLLFRLFFAHVSVELEGFQQLVADGVHRD